MVKDNNIQVFFDLLRAGLFPVHGEGQFPVHGEGFRANGSIFSDVDWGKVYQLAQEQSVQGIVLQGIEELRAKGVKLSVPKILLLQWIGEVQMIEQRNKEMNAFVADLIEKLRKADIYALLVKGQGVAQCYEKPLWRCPGDVDLLLSKENYEKSKAFIMPMGVLTEPEEAGKKHLAMQIGQWVVELHGTLHVGLSANVDRMLDNVQYDIIHKGEVRSWMNGNTQVFLPAANEDVVYVFAHILQHFYKGGIGLRQICDWCRLLWTYKNSLSYEMLESRIRKMGVMSEWKTFGALAIEYLGFPKDSMPLLDSTTVYLGFKVVSDLKPKFSIDVTASPARESTAFVITHDRPGQNASVTIQVSSSDGMLQWASTVRDDSGSGVTVVDWNLHGNSGHRMQPGLYIVRAIVGTDGGGSASASCKLVIVGR